MRVVVLQLTDGSDCFLVEWVHWRGYPRWSFTPNVDGARRFATPEEAERWKSQFSDSPETRALWFSVEPVGR